MQTTPIIKEVLLDAPVEKVWQAITDKQQMKEWYFDMIGFEPVVSTEFYFMGGAEDKVYKHLSVVKEVIPNKKLSYTWRYENMPGDSLVTFELFDENGKTRLRLTHDGVETFTTEDPNFARNNFVMGWNEIIGNLIKAYVEKQ